MTLGGDCCIGFFDEAYDSGALVFPTGARELEIGSAEFDWLTAFGAVRPDLDLVGIDWRISSSPKAIKGDVLTHEFAPASFDAIVSISTLEHIGLGGYDHDPIDDDGDTHAIQRAWTWLKPGGWLYFDVPYRPEGPYAVNTNYRAYDPAAFDARLRIAGAIERWRQLFTLHTPDAPYLAVVWEKA